ncbi:hypothetical protein FSP39_017122 [Pinctada imbricata]|uniref:Reverse transcriptase domain-containing protein n=1 Tax=Pinctada imbricata TaxID=66713 RepID=A0AA88YRM7_PINIB|nr:hypothetical protein FSP39_017122 [Pinctada imbricata]
MLLIVLILLCNDIAENPGPESSVIHGFSVFHLNIRSIRNKLNDVENLLDEFDIACFTETHLDTAISLEDIEIPGFEPPFRKDRTNHGGGILIYYRSGLTVKRRVELENDIDESIWIELLTKNKSLLICCLYRPPNSRNDFWDRLEQSVGSASDSSQALLLCGDWNVDFHERLPSRIKDLLSLYDLSNVINESTRLTDTTAKCIDPIILSDTTISQESGTIDARLSDHMATYVTLNFETPVRKTFLRKVWLYKECRFENMRDEISTTDWSFLNDGNDIDNTVSLFSDKLKTIMNKHIPRKEVTIRPLDKAWFNSEIRREIRHRDRLRKIYRRTGKTSDRVKYKNQRNKVNNMKKRLKEKYFESMNDSLRDYKQTDSKTYWKLIGSLIKGGNKNNEIPTLDYNGQSAFSDESKCNMFNDYFCSVSDLDDSNIDLPPFENRTASEISDVDISIDEIIDQIKILDPKKAVGPDEFSHPLLKNVCNEIATPLSIIFNKSLQLGKFPSQWKHAYVLPIFKKGEKSSPSNYRPISLLSCIGKLFERVMFKHFYNYLQNYDLLYRLQAGFRPGQSTVTQLIEIYHQICVAIDNREFSCFTFCDISKAFDRVWIKGLVYKLGKYGFKGRVLSWISDYLSSRTQQVKFQESASSTGHLRAGVPQGSVLGPLFFLIYINDLPDGLLGLTRLFADDTSNSHTSSNLQKIKDDNDHDLLKIKKWATDWLVDFNPKKTEIMIFGNSSIDYNSLNFSFDGEMIHPSLTHRHLGIIFSADAKWTKHVDSIIARVSKQISVLRKLKYTIKKNFLSNIYLTFIRPSFEYASEVWDNLSNFDEERLEKFQLEAGRIVTGLPSYCSRAAIYFETGWETLKERRHNRKLNLMYKVQHNLAPDYLSNLIPSQVGSSNSYNLRNSENINLPFCRTSLLQSSFIPSSINAWNDLPLSVRSSTSLSQFKAKLKSETTRSAHFDFGDRKLQILHSRLRHGCSTLNGDLFRINVTNSSMCSCGAQDERALHFFIQCQQYNTIRRDLFSKLNQIGASPDIGTILYGDPDLSYTNNIEIFKAVHRYISQSKRF